MIYASKPAGRILPRLFKYLIAHKLLFTISTVLVVAGTVIDLLLPWISRDVINNVFIGSASNIWIYAIAILGLTVLHGTLFFLRDYLSGLMSQKISHNMRLQLYKHLQDLSYSFFDRVDVGQIINRLTSDIDTIGNFISSSITQLLNSTLVILLVSVIIISINASMALIAISITVPFIAIISMIFAKLVRPIFERRWIEQGRLNTAVAESVSGFRIIRALGIENWAFTKFNFVNKQVYDLSMRSEKLGARTWPFLNLVIGVSSAIVYWYGGLRFFNNEITIGDLIAFSMYLGFLVWPIMSFGFLFADYQRTNVSAGRVFEALDAEPEVKEKPNAMELPNIKGHVVFENVVFGYDPDKPVLKGVDLEVKPGEKIALVGITGSGKSTLIKLIPRFYDPQKGRILMDGYDIRDVKLSSLRKQIGVVHQDIFLFPMSIRENIAYGKPNATYDEIEKASKIARIHDFIMSLPEKYDTVIGERGVTLSGGQRQRLAIARALILNPRILILDDSTSSVDSETEKEICEALKELIKDKTVFIVTQRLSTLKLADRIVVLDDGRVVEDGSHDELMAKNGLYTKIYKSQILGSGGV
ncbi:ABC transporter ATP-binding protein [Candidatus Bathyarchaeota archaeon]|nr:ABC transporter ATP-binding protein [Candidatus Bathyarchaeota archaeon]